MKHKRFPDADSRQGSCASGELGTLVDDVRAKRRDTGNGQPARCAARDERHRASPRYSSNVRRRLQQDVHE